MDKKEILFITVFVLSLSTLVLLLGLGITGNATQTMYCKDGECNTLCKIDSECATSEVCCDVDGYGLCTTSCEKRYEFNPPFDMDKIQKMPITEKPTQIEPLSLYFIGFLILVAVLIGSVYIKEKKK